MICLKEHQYLIQKKTTIIVIPRYIKITAIVLCDFINYLAPFCDFKTNNGLRKRYKLPNIWFLPNANSCPSIQKCSIWGKVLTPINKSYLHIWYLIHIWYDKNIFEYHLDQIIKFKFSGILIRKELVMNQNRYLGYPISNFRLCVIIKVCYYN